MGAGPQLDVAAISHTGHGDWKEEQCGKRGGTKQEAHKRTNWYHPLLWVHISTAAQKNNWSLSAMVTALQREQPKLFSHLNRGTVSKWIEKLKHQWSQATLRNVANGHTLSGSGNSGVLSQHPHVQDEIVERLKNLRQSGVPINVIVARSIMLAVIQNHVPKLLETFKCSEVYKKILPRLSYSS